MCGNIAFDIQKAISTHTFGQHKTYNQLILQLNSICKPSGFESELFIKHNTSTTPEQQYARSSNILNSYDIYKPLRILSSTSRQVPTIIFSH